MEKVEELKEKVNKYVIELILNSDVEKDWNNGFSKNNVIIYAYNNRFEIIFKGASKWENYEYDIYPVKFKFSFLFNKKLRIENKKLKLKLKEISYYKENSSDLNKLKKK
jgi:hypothetical protein